VYDLFVYKDIVAYNGQKMEFSGKIIDYQVYGDNENFTFNGKFNDGTKLKATYFGPSVNYTYGDKVSLVATFSTFENSYLFPSADYNNSNGIYLQVKELEKIDFEKMPKSFKTYLYDFKQTYLEQIRKIFPQTEGEMLAGMLFGDEKLTDYEQDSMLRAGILHIMSVGGFHLTLIAGIFGMLVSRLKVSVVARFLAVEGLMTAFALMTGFGPPVMRAWFAATLYFLGPLFCRKSDFLTSISIFIFISTLSCPKIISNSSFLLTIFGTIGMGLVAPYFAGEIKNVFLQGIVTMGCITLTILPISVIFFDETSLISPLTNLLLIPICTLAIILGIVGAFFCLFGFFAYPLIFIAGNLCKIVIKICEFVSNLPVLYINTGEEYVVYLTILGLIIVISAFLITKNRKITGKFLVFSMVLIIIFNTVISNYGNDLKKVAVLGKEKDVAMVIFRNKNATIIDYGGNTAYKYVGKYVREQGLNSFDVVLLGNESYARQRYEIVLKSYKIKSILKKESENITISSDDFVPDLSLVNVEYIFDENNQPKVRKIS
jgi:ComEC/Rec2-related protein